MRIIPVLDLKGSQVVRGRAGRREEYQPVVSKLAHSSEPTEIGAAFRTHFGLDSLYIADLDAIAGASPNTAVYWQLRRLGFQLWVDAGLRRAGDATVLLAAGVEQIIFGLESLE